MLPYVISSKRKLSSAIILVFSLALMLAVGFSSGGASASVVAALPGGLAAGSPLPAAQSASPDQPFDCSRIRELGIDRQMNLHADQILAACSGKAGPVSGNGKSGNTNPFKPLLPEAYGGLDVNVHPPTSPSIQSES